MKSKFNWRFAVVFWCCLLALFAFAVRARERSRQNRQIATADRLTRLPSQFESDSNPLPPDVVKRNRATASSAKSTTTSNSPGMSYRHAKGNPVPVRPAVGSKNRRVFRLASTSTTSQNPLRSAQSNAGRISLAQNPSDGDTLLMGNPYHKGGKYTAPTQNSVPQHSAPQNSVPQITIPKSSPAPIQTDTHVDSVAPRVQKTTGGMKPQLPTSEGPFDKPVQIEPPARNLSSDVHNQVPTTTGVTPPTNSPANGADTLLNDNPFMRPLDLEPPTQPDTAASSATTTPSTTTPSVSTPANQPVVNQPSRKTPANNSAPRTQREPMRPDVGNGDDLLQGNPYHENARPQPPAQNFAKEQEETRPSNSMTKPVINMLNQNAAAAQQNAPASPQQQVDSSDFTGASPSDSNQPADTEDDDDLFGNLYDDIEEDKAEKAQKREERGENKKSKKDEYVDPHYELYSKEMYPSAKQCAKCHEQIYKEWAVSSHAYASLSPMFNRFEQKLNGLAQGTVGYFCLRCHNPVATAMGVERDEAVFDLIPAASEGITCIACHRVSERYTRVNGERLVEPGPIFNPVYGASDGSGVDDVIAKADHYKVKTSPHGKGPGQSIHDGAIFFDQLNKSEFCVSCHQVAVFPGIKLEVVWEQYRASPACKAGISCQDCHMGKVPGKPLGYATAPGAIVGGKAVNPNRKHSNHMFYGPGYSVAHPGIFPFNLKADEYDWTPQDWLQFDYRAQWGSEAFEEAVDDGRVPNVFPPVWADAEDRRDAWDIVQENMETMAMEKQVRTQLMENSSHIDGPFFHNKPKCGKALKFHYDVSNLNSGHNAPSGSLGAQPQIWVNAVLVNPRGERVWESGYTDSIGDVADTLSLEVAAGRCKPDHQLVNFQSKFLFTSVKGTDREWFLPVNVDFDQLPFLRPSGFPITTLNHPPFIRMEQRSLPPLSTKKASYKVPGKALKVPGKYRLSVRMRSRSHPIYFVRYCDGTPDMERRINEGMLDFHQDSVEFVVR